MSPYSGENAPSFTRYLVVPLLVLVAAVAFVVRQEGQSHWDATTREGAGATVGTRVGPTADGGSAAGDQLAAQGGTAGSAAAVAYHHLKPGECFDIDRAAPGSVVRRGCDRPHDAQLVAVVRLTGEHRTDRQIRDAAAALCREPLRRKASAQPRGTRWTTFVQYPYRSGYLLGADTVACSLTAHAAPGAAARPLTARLR
ncbi:hypothetical protein ACF09C_29320 [Streptomyces sp. NPDC014870]|uniref:hypothetical protein n=1 Tax=Streptomyces sp. NPDC014870 TaxID=3364925 RepID=UPI0037001B9B